MLIVLGSGLWETSNGFLGQHQGEGGCQAAAAEILRVWRARNEC